MNSDVAVRLETVADVRSTARAHIAAWKAGYQGLVPPDVLAQMDEEQQVAKRTRALAEPDGSTTLVAVRQQQVLGHVTVRPYPDEPFSGQVWACYTHPDAWGSGVADDLLTAGLLLLDQQMVRLWVLRDNRRAVASYARHGFRADGDQTMYSFGGTNLELPLIRMTLDRAECG